MSLESSEVRRAFRRIATNVAIVTTAGPHGCTANAWAEAADPPLLLVTLRRGGRTLARLDAERRFAVNVLAAGQADVARRFARPGDRFAGVTHRPGAIGLPLLDAAIAHFECAVEATHPFGAHVIVVGRVHAAEAAGGAPPPLLFVDGGFAGPGARL